MLNQQDEGANELLMKSCQGSKKVSEEVAGIVPPSERLEARVGDVAAEGVGGQEVHPVVTAGRFEAFVRATRSTDGSE